MTPAEEAYPAGQSRHNVLPFAAYLPAGHCFLSWQPQPSEFPRFKQWLVSNPSGAASVDVAPAETYRPVGAQRQNDAVDPVLFMNLP